MLGSPYSGISIAGGVLLLLRRLPLSYSLDLGLGDISGGRGDLLLRLYRPGELLGLLDLLSPRLLSEVDV